MCEKKFLEGERGDWAADGGLLRVLVLVSGLYTLT